MNSLKRSLQRRAMFINSPIATWLVIRSCHGLRAKVASPILWLGLQLCRPSKWCEGFMDKFEADCIRYDRLTNPEKYRGK